MKFMKLGTRPDTFYTEEATRSVSSDVPSDLIIQINSIKYLLHKFPLLPKCGLLQRLCVDSGDPAVTIELHDIPGGEEAFELCAKFCYGITINLSAHNFVPAFCGAKFLRMTESIEKGNLVLKLEAFFNSCILEGWKDSIVTLQTTEKLPEWSENLGIIRRCIDSVVEKILTHPSKVTWSYTYTRPGYAKKRHLSVPKDWWTEDVSDLDIDLFRCIITAIRSTNLLPPQLIGEALHVYACRWLPDTTKSSLPESSASQNEEAVEKHRRVLETIVSMIPTDRRSVSFGFLLRLLNGATFLGVSPATKSELIRRSSWQLEEATISDLVFPSHSSDRHFYDIDLVRTVLESFLVQWRRQASADEGESVRTIRKVAKLIDSYLQVVARDVNMPAIKVVYLAECLPEIARPEHDELYKAINIYLKEHPDLSKAEKKRLCRILDCQKLSPEICAHVVRNERLPLRTVVQVLFFEQERGTRPTSQKLPPSEDTLVGHPVRSISRGENHSKPKWEPEVRSGGAQSIGKATMPSFSERDHHRMMKSDGRLSLESERKVVKEIRELEMEKGKEIGEERVSGGKLKPKIMEKRSKSDHGRYRGRDR
ncbi:hypothetical protein HHK36_003428 [Tetracentron sinense]|uniref:NPH3 domain-containing protein n=1 Tax=Tetracentron sinense TaxID=13715 RepID=A0A834ZP99_TETSI|nr:hypothetical protein HHK36_003428 [Tetracentron sinense]